MPEKIDPFFEETLEQTVPASEFNAEATCAAIKRAANGDTSAGEQNSTPVIDETSFEKRTRELLGGVRPSREKRYDITGLLGTGSTGRVYLARDNNLERDLALKFLHKNDSAQLSAIQRLIHEARMTARLEHPNILPLYDLGYTEKGPVYFSMRKAHGESLGAIMRRIKKGEPAPAVMATDLDKIEVFLKLCEAVAYAHHRGVIHQDIKPDNVMIGDFGEVVLVDWGTAYSTRDNEPSDCSLVGTPAYMSPEQARGERADKRSDIYCLGATLYHLLTLQHPTRSDDVHTFWAMKRRGELSPLDTTAVAHVPSLLVAACLKAMAADPDDRFSSVSALQSALRQYQRHAESISLVSAAQSVADRAARGADYEYFREAITQLKNALSMWPENPQAQSLLCTTRKSFAESALTKGDYELAISIVRQEPALKDILDRAVELRNKRNIRRKHTRAAWGVAGFFGVIVLSLAVYLYLDQLRYVGDWELMYDQDFTRPGANLSGLSFAELILTNDIAPPRLSDSGLELPAQQMIWFENIAARGDVRLEVTAYWPREVDGLEMHLNAERTNPRAFFWCLPGFACQFGGFRGRVNAISRNDSAQVFDAGEAVPKSFAPGKTYTFAFEHRGDTLRQYVNGHVLNERIELLPLAGGNHERVALRAWTTIILTHVQIWRRALPEKASPLIAGDALVAAGYHTGAVKQYLTIADDFPLSRLGEKALAKGFFSASLLQDSTIQTLAGIRNRITREYPQTTFLPLLNESECVSLWRTGNCEQALIRGNALLDKYPDSRIALRILTTPRNLLPDSIATRLLTFVARTRAVTRLNLSRLGITDLSPLAGMNLQWLDISENSISSLEPLRGMPLTELNFEHNLVSDLQPLRSMPLNGLRCADNDIRSLEPLTGMPLKDLNCETNRIETLEPLKDMALEQLQCGQNRIADLSPLAGLPLNRLFCSNNLVQSLEPLRGMALDALGCTSNNITSVEPLRGMPLKTLYLDRNPIRDLSALASMPLRFLTFDHCPVESLEPLAGMPLEGVTLSGTRAKSLEPLKGILLKELECDNTNIDNLEPLAGMPLTLLKCSNNAVSSLKPLRMCKELVMLSCYGNPLLSLEPYETQPPPQIFVADFSRFTREYMDNVLAAWDKNHQYSDITRVARAMMAIDAGDAQGARAQAHSFDGHRYLLLPIGLTWSQTDALAKKLGGHMLTVTSDSEFEFTLDLQGEGTTVWLDHVGYPSPKRWRTGEEVLVDKCNEGISRQGHYYWYQSNLFALKPCWLGLAESSALAGVIIEWDY